jgi:hypothetical protein
MGDPGLAGQVAQADRGRANLGDCLDGGLQQGPPEVAVVEGRASLLAGGVVDMSRAYLGILSLTRSTRER